MSESGRIRIKRVILQEKYDVIKLRDEKVEFKRFQDAALLSLKIKHLLNFR